jgi:hypothetical protein
MTTMNGSIRTGTAASVFAKKNTSADHYFYAYAMNLYLHKNPRS